MHNNYYFLRQISSALKKELEGFELGECFSQNKDELILGFFSGQKEFHIKAILTSSFSSLNFPGDFKRSKKNSVNLFKEIIGLKVIEIKQHLNERSFHIEFENNFKLMFKMHGRRANLVLFKNDGLLSLFNNQLKNDLDIDINKTDRIIDQTYDAFESNNGSIHALFPTFGKNIETYVESKISKGKDRKEKWNLLQNIILYLSQPEFFIKNINKQTFLSLFEGDGVIYKTNNPIEAINYFSHKFLTSDSFEQERKKVIAELEKKKIKSESYIQDLHEKLIKISRELKFDEIANIIMANLHAIPERSESIELFDFYNDKETIIKLKKNLSPQKNAEEYYRKSKNQKIEIEKLKENIENKVEDIKSTSIHLYELGNIQEPKALRKYLKDNLLIKENKDENDEPSLFKYFSYEGFEILIGKNAKNNDLLTQKYSYKEDLWLHARDVSGSHVVIKYQSGKKFPKTVIQKAAELAAYYSKRKTDILCPVIFTPKKFVRKKKGAPEGSVIIEKEEVIMVEPKKF